MEYASHSWNNQTENNGWLAPSAVGEYAEEMLHESWVAMRKSWEAWQRSGTFGSEMRVAALAVEPGMRH
jgi:hypothetical protein